MGRDAHMRRGDAQSDVGSDLTPPEGRILWPDALRVVAMLAVFAAHYIGALPLSAGPLASDAIRAASVPFAVSIFIMLGGFMFALTESRVISRPYGTALKERLRRLLIPYWIVAIPFMAAALLSGEMRASELPKAVVWLTGLNILSPAVYLPVSEAWWYVTLAIQVAIIAPILPRLRDSVGHFGLAVLALSVNCVVLLAIRMLPSDWEYLAQGLVLARLTELTIGYVIGSALFQARDRLVDLATLATVGVLAAGGARMHTIGMWTPPIALLGVTALFALCAARYGTSRVAGAAGMLVAPVAATSYVFYLSHTPIVRMVVRLGHPSSTAQALMWAPIALAASAVCAWAFQQLCVIALRRWRVTQG
jgi:peptidoglycan/LPS O-acetylase OafA/YrhL